MTESGRPELFHEFYPRYVSPSPALFLLPVRTPTELRLQIESAFVLSWGDYEASLNRIRVALETLLDLLKVPRFFVKGGKRHFLTLHRRAELAGAKITDVAPFMIAAKHLGNAGSHRTGLKRDDVFDALELLEAVLVGVYGNQKDVVSLARKVAKARGPIRRKTV